MTCRAITHHKCFHRVLEASTTRGAIDRHDAALKSRCAMPCHHASLKNRLPTTCVSIGSAPRVTPGKSNIAETLESDKQAIPNLRFIKLVNRLTTYARASIWIKNVITRFYLVKVSA